MKYLVLLLLVCSCATAKKKAIELSEKGQHEEAIAQWAEALKSDPDDDEVKDGLRQSLEVVSNDKLTKIRDSRLANQYQVAIDELKALTDLQKKYNIKLDFNSSTFQGKEVQYLWPHYKAGIKTKIKNNMPLSAEADQRHFQDVFASMNDWHQVQADVKKNGVAKCVVLKKSGENKPFYRSFVSQFCKYWGPERELSHTTISSVLFSQATAEGHIHNLNPSHSGVLQTALNKSFTNSPWYHPEATKAIKVKLSGNYDWKPTSKNIRQVHNYNVKVPYTDYEMVKEKRLVPYSATENGVMVTKYRTDYQKVSRQVTRYRTEPRIYEYQALKKTMTLSLNLSGHIQIDNDSRPYSYVMNETEEKILHDINIPDIGLYPQKEDVSSPMVKFESYSVNAAKKFESDLNNIWEKSFCTLPNDRSLASVGDNVMRCQRLASYPQEFVNSWFKNHFGVTAGRARELIGQF